MVKQMDMLSPAQAEEIINNFLIIRDKDKLSEDVGNEENIDAEVRICVGSCCMAGGSKEIL